MSSPYLRALEEFYMVKAEAMDFRGDNCKLSTENINDWIRTKTDGKISKVMTSSKCDSNLFIASAVALNAQLLNQFQSSDTFHKGLFYLPGNKRFVLQISKKLACSIINYSIFLVIKTTLLS